MKNISSIILLLFYNFIVEVRIRKAIKIYGDEIICFLQPVFFFFLLQDCDMIEPFSLSFKCGIKKSNILYAKYVSWLVFHLWIYTINCLRMFFVDLKKPKENLHLFPWKNLSNQCLHNVGGYHYRQPLFLFTVLIYLFIFFILFCDYKSI